MTHLCYTLEEAAEKLKLSETVLVRLSQYFKVPRAAYEDVGYLSFKGDLAFMEQDIEFFRHAKERLLSGQSLDEVKSRMREEAVTSPVRSEWREVPKLSHATHSATAISPESGKGQTAYAAIQAAAEAKDIGTKDMESQSKPWIPPWAADKASDNAKEASAIREINDRKPYEKAAEQSFERYKSIHRTGLGKVFENMLKEVGSSASRRRRTQDVPGFRPMRRKVADNLGSASYKQGESNRSDALLPFVRGLGASLHTVSGGRLGHAAQSGELSWEQMIQDAANHPRNMNTNLKSAAALLKAQALKNTSEQKKHQPK